MRALIVAMVGCSALVVACTRDANNIDIVPLPAPTSTHRVEDVEANRVRVWATSAEARKDVHYRFKLYTRCGVGNAIVDFDGTLWFIPPPGLDLSIVIGLDQPESSGTITLISQSTARFVSFDNEVIEFLREEGSRIYPRCALAGI